MTPYTSTNAVQVAITANMAQNQVLTSMIDSIIRGGLINPAVLESFGINDIQTYRTKFLKLLVKANMTTEKAKILIQLTMQVKNYSRLKIGLEFHKESWANHPVINDVKKFIEDHCCQSTKNAGEKMPTVKIPESFPEICFMIHVTTFALVPTTAITQNQVEALIDDMLMKPWMASLALDPTLQAINKAAVKAMWDTWGAGGKKNSSNEQIKFEDAYYENQANDKIMLLDLQGNTINPVDGVAYTKAELVAVAIGMVQAMSGTNLPMIAAN